MALGLLKNGPVLIKKMALGLLKEMPELI